MKDNRKAWLQKIHSDPLFEQYIIKELNKLRPSLPSWDPNNDNTENWKERSAKQAGFDLAMTVLAVKPEND